jgi:transcriptional regulator of nitric oxide reductase
VRAVALSLLVTFAVAALPAAAKVFHSRQEALALAFSDADDIAKKTHILTSEQTSRIEELSRSKLESKLVTLFTARRAGEVLGYAHIDIHTVRTHPEAFLVVLRPDGVVRSVRILAFHEPLEYMPSDRWYAQFEGKTRDDRLRVDADVHGVIGATLSTRVAAAAVRRALAYHAVLILGEGS